MKLSKILSILSVLTGLAITASTYMEAINPKWAIYVVAGAGVISALTKAVQEKVVPIVEPEGPTVE